MTVPRTVVFKRNLAGPSGSHLAGDLAVVGAAEPLVPDDTVADALVAAGVVADVPVPPGVYVTLPGDTEKTFIQDTRV